MPTVESFAIIGGDLRFAYLAGALVSEGYRVISTGLDEVAMAPCVTGCTSVSQALALADAVILPMPVSNDGVTLNAPFSHRSISVDTVLSEIGSEKILFGGAPSIAVSEKLNERELVMYDYLAREELALQNAVPTAEGAIQLAMEELPVTLAGAHCLVTGYGRVARALSELLVAMRANVTVAVRKCADSALAGMHGCETVRFSDMTLGGYDVIFNAVPHQIFTQEILEQIPRETLIIDLASRPGGVDFNAAARLQIKTIWALSLPGRVAPKTAGYIIKDTLLNMLGEMT